MDDAIVVGYACVCRENPAWRVARGVVHARCVEVGEERAAARRAAAAAPHDAFVGLAALFAQQLFAVDVEHGDLDAARSIGHRHLHLQLEVA